jgi:two-component system NarL family sensor kinase
MADRQVQERGALHSKLEELLLQQRELTNRLRHGQDQFKRLARSVWSVQEQERRNLARELHDGIGQNLTAIVNLIGLSLQRPVPSRDELEKARALAEMTLQETRELSRFLRPTILDDLGLLPALGWLARTMGEANGWSVELSLPEPMPPMDGEASTLVFRAIQESLTNAAKHARAKNVRIDLYAKDHTMHLSIIDDGCGCSVEQSASGQGSGLGGLRDRVRAHDGTLHVESSPGKGFRVFVEFPLPEAPSA